MTLIGCQKRRRTAFTALQLITLSILKGEDERVFFSASFPSSRREYCKLALLKRSWATAHRADW